MNTHTLYCSLFWLSPTCCPAARNIQSTKCGFSLWFISISFLLSENLMCNEYIYTNKNCVCIQSLIYYIPLWQRAPLLSKKTIKTLQLVTLLHWVTCSFITGNTLVYLDSISHTPSWCHKYSLEHHMWIHLPLKIVPNKYTISSCMSNVC